MLRNSRRIKILRLAGCILGTAVLGLLACGSPVSKTEQTLPKPPNLMLIVADDLGLQVGCYGNDRVGTPYTDRLAEEGMLFRRAFVCTAICSPCRATMYTGMYPQTNGMMGFAPQHRMHDGVRPLPNWLKEMGYRTALIGKFHVSPPEAFQWDYYQGLSGMGAVIKRDKNAYASRVRTFLEMAADGPFFLSVCFYDPHRPFPLAGGGKGIKAPVPNPHDPGEVIVPPKLVDDPAVREDLARYYDIARRFDEGVGAVLNELDKAGHRDDTLVLLTSDHGAPFAFAKTTLYDAGLNVPFVVRWPGVVKPGSRTDRMVSFVDIAPTFLAAAGCPIPDEMDGRSFIPILRGEKPGGWDTIYGSHTDHIRRTHFPMRAIRTERYKYIRNLRPDIEFRNFAWGTISFKRMMQLAETDPAVADRVEIFKHRPLEELFDLEKDPYELHNLAGDPAHQPVLQELRQRLRTWMMQTDDPLLNGWDPRE